MLGKIASSILELVHNFELDVGQAFDLDQVRSKLNINKREAKTPIKVPQYIFIIDKSGTAWI